MEKKEHFAIPHPGTLEWIEPLTFEEARDKGFEGFNVPRKIINSEAEPFKDSVDRVRRYYKMKPESNHE